jgi:sporulation protein YlmC with PRC-barrel domain
MFYKEQNYEYITTYYYNNPIGRRTTCLALQPRLGLLARWFGRVNFNHLIDINLARKVLTGDKIMSKEIRSVLSASTLTGDTVENDKGEKLGKLEDIMLDLQSGKIAYAVLSFGGFLGMGEKLFALPWSKLHVDQVKKCIILNASKELFKDMPGFNKDHYPDMSDPKWQTKITTFYQNW